MNSRQEFEQPAIVKQASTVSEAKSAAKSALAKVKRDKVESGKRLLELKEVCIQAHANFTDELKEVCEAEDISESTAHRYMALAAKNDEPSSKLAKLTGNAPDESQIDTPDTMPKPSSNGHSPREQFLSQSKPQSYVDTHAVPSRNGHTKQVQNGSETPQPFREPGDDYAAEGEPDHGKGIRLSVPNENAGLPKSVQMALADRWHADCALNLSRMRTECKGAFSWSSWLDGEVLVHLKAAEECFLAAVPKVVCPDCKGMKQVKKVACLRCKNGGYLAGQVVEENNGRK